MSLIPENLFQTLLQKIQSLGDHSDILWIEPVAGGYINQVVCVETQTRKYLFKWNEQPLPGLFLDEAHGLNLLAKTRTVRVPAVFAVADRVGDIPGYILLEWLNGPSGSEDKPDYAALGCQVAHLHLHPMMPGYPVAYGLDKDNYQGPARQYNGWDVDWVRFYKEKRLLPQMDTCSRLGFLTVQRRRRLDWICDHLDLWLGGIERRPSLLHGDLWSGNVLISPDGQPALIDPAVYYGDREAEIAYTLIFGGSFEDCFYDAYHEVWPIEAGFEERRDLYNLYHILNHISIFGEEYGTFLDAVLLRYAGHIR